MEPHSIAKARSFATLVAIALMAGCAGETETGESEDAHASARDTLADELGALICTGSSSCCTSLGYGRPGETCRMSMRNAVMIGVIEAEDADRELIPDRIDPCLASFETAIEAAEDCASLPAPGELLLRCPDLFTPAPTPTERSGAVPPCPHDEQTCGYPVAGQAPDEEQCPGGDCWTLVFENVCR
jgi:hypothetical protein